LHTAGDVVDDPFVLRFMCPSNRTGSSSRIAAGRLSVALAFVASALAACCQVQPPPIALAPLAQTRGAPGSAWIHLHRPDEGFAVEVPAQPATTSEVIRSIVGPQRIVRYGGQAQDISFEVGYLIRNGNPLARLASADQILGAAAKGTLEHFAAQVNDTEAIEIAGYPARSLSVVQEAAAGDRPGRILLALTPTRIFHVVVFRDADADACRSERIFDSFTVLADPNA
jgi:hypothetical protein